MKKQQDEILKLLNEMLIVQVYQVQEIRRIEEKLEMELTEDPDGVKIEIEK